jgi:hypothetical protein
MRNYADEVNLHARIHAMRGRLLCLRDYGSMVREQAPDSLSPSAAQDPVVARQTLFRQQIAPVLGLVEACERYTPLFLAFLRQYEAQNARLLLAKAFGKKSLEFWYDIGPFAVFDQNLLGKKLSPDEVRSLLAGTYLGGDFRDVSSYRQMDVRLETSAVLNLHRAATFLSKRAQREFQDIMLKRIGVLTVIWSWRLRQCYRWSEENIRLYKYKIHDLFGGQVYSRVLIEEKALARGVEQLRSPGGSAPSTVDIERYLDRKFYAWVSAMFHRDFHSLYCVVGYLWLLFYQIKNLFCIIDGKRFGLSPDRILDRIIAGA